ncbi:MAG TPA: hypothetical protein ACFCUD_10830 [Cyclobacteriaceae bacterium]
MKVSYLTKNPKSSSLSLWSGFNFRLRTMFDRIYRYEYWPFALFYTPIFIYWVYITLKTRSIFFFTSSNPSIDFGGYMGESKYDIYSLIPRHYLPVTTKISPVISIDELISVRDKSGITYPCIVKPDRGERGWKVEKIGSDRQLIAYHQNIKVDYLIQEFVDYKEEIGIFYYRYPNEQKGHISSLVLKEHLSVVGDGSKNVRQLMMQNTRSYIQIKEASERRPALMDYVPHKGERIMLEPIGNHCRGTRFINGSGFISNQLVETFDKISAQINGFYFGRYDVKAASVQDLEQGINFKILELNGAGSEPGHIYDSNYTLLKAYRDVIHHLKVLADISAINNKNGITYLPFGKGVKRLKEIIRHNKLKKSID